MTEYTDEAHGHAGGNRRNGTFHVFDGCEFMTADTVYITGGGGFR